MIFNVREDKKVISNFSLISFDGELHALNLLIRNSATKYKASDK